MVPPKATDERRADWTFEQIYNFLMVEIEPELTTWMLPELAKLYEHEVLRERQERSQRYQSAFQRFEEVYAERLAQWERNLKEYEKRILSVWPADA